MKRAVAAALIALAAGLAGAAPGDLKIDKERQEQASAQLDKERAERVAARERAKAEPGVERVFEGRSTAFWIVIGAILGVPIVLVAGRRR